MDNLKDMKDEVLVMTNASDGNKPHVVERIEQDGSLKTQPLAKAKPDGDFLKIGRSESILEAFFSNFKRQFDNPSDFRFYHIPAELLAAAKDMADLFRKPEENAAMIDGYRLDPEQHVQKQDLRQAPATEDRWTGSSSHAWASRPNRWAKSVRHACSTGMNLPCLTSAPTSRASALKHRPASGWWNRPTENPYSTSNAANGIRI